MPHIDRPWSMQSTVMGWQPKEVRGKPAFPSYKPKFATSDFFSLRYPTTARYRESLSPAQIYSGVSRESYVEHLKTSLSRLPCDKTLQVRWRLSKEKPAFSMEFLRMFLTRKYGPIDALYQLAVNSCLVVFKNAESAFVLGRDKHAGEPHGRLFTRRWNPLPQDDSYFRVLKHLEKAAETKARFNELMDRVDRQGMVSQEHAYSRALAVRNKTYGPSMLPVLSHGKDVEGLFKVITPPEVKQKPTGAESQLAAASRMSQSADPESNSRVRPAHTQDGFLELLQERPLTVIKFYATWCGPCKAVAPQVDQLSTEHPDVTFVAVDVDENSDTADMCNILVLPTFQFFIRGRLVEEMRGNAVHVIQEKIRTMKLVLEGLNN